MAAFIRDSNQAEASRIAAAVPGIPESWLHAKACNSRKRGASVGFALLAEGWSEKSLELHFAGSSVRRVRNCTRPAGFRV